MAIGHVRGAGALLWIAAVIGLSACSSGTAPRTGGGGAVPGTTCAPENVTQHCNCADQAGSQRCGSGAWLACECAALTVAGAGGSAGTGANSSAHGGDAGGAAQVDGGAISNPPGNSSAARFEWKRTKPGGGSCLPGHYVGAFTGMYNAGGIIPLLLPVASVDDLLTGKPGLEFWLKARPGSEILDASGGKVRGNANGLYPFEIDLVGSLDCSAGKFTGELNGWYDATLGLGAKNYFAGPVTADYDPITHQFVNGKWTVLETVPDGGLPPLGGVAPGGNGDWNATFKP